MGAWPRSRRTYTDKRLIASILAGLLGLSTNAIQGLWFLYLTFLSLSTGSEISHQLSERSCLVYATGA